MDLRERATSGEAIAAVLFEAPTGRDGVLVTAGGDRVLFGRSIDCAIRFGYAPEPDLRLPRCVGALLVAHGRRLVVECAEGPGARSLAVVAGERTLGRIEPGEVYAPAVGEFGVVATGDQRWEIQVKVKRWPAIVRSEAAEQEPPTEVPSRPSISLTPRAREVLEAYAAPVRAGGADPATHNEVAALLAYSRSTVRADLYELWQDMVAAGLEVPDYKDKSRAVVAAAVSAGLL